MPDQPSLEDIARLYRSLLLIRRTEEEVARLYPSDKIKSPVHLSIGQEFVAVGACDPLNDDDVVSITYRGHAGYLAKGGDLDSMMAELYGKEGGCARGKAGSMHLVDMSKNILGASAVVGTSNPVAMGYAYALKREGKGRVVLSFFGDGATEEGVFVECLNFAAIHKLPILFLCENNRYAIHSPIENRRANTEICPVVEAYGVPAHKIDSGDIFELRGTVQKALTKIRAGDGPVFIEAACYRWREHVGPNGDFDAGYRGEQELAPWKENDQVTRLGAMLSADERQAIDSEVEYAVSEAIQFAEQSPFPAKEEVFDNVYA